MVYNHTIFMKCCEIPHIPIKLGNSGEFRPRAEIPLPEPYETQYFLQPPVESTRACDSNFFLLFQIKHENSSFPQEFQEKHDFTCKSPEIRLLYLKTPKKPIGFVAVFSPGPAGAPLLPKSTNFHPISPKWR